MKVDWGSGEVLMNLGILRVLGSGRSRAWLSKTERVPGHWQQQRLSPEVHRCTLMESGLGQNLEARRSETRHVVLAARGVESEDIKHAVCCTSGYTLRT